MMSVSLLLALSFLIGSIPTGLWLGKARYGVDIRKGGSGNPGMTNVYRLLGWKPALVVGLVDGLKGWAAASWLPVMLSGESSSLPPDLSSIFAGLVSVLGHSYSIFSGFSGGKGVATAAGVLVAVFPRAVLPCLAVFLITLLLWGFVSVSSIAAAATLPLAVLFVPGGDAGDPTAGQVAFAILVPLLIFYTHRSNIARLRAGTESRFDRIRIFRRRS